MTVKEKITKALKETGINTNRVWKGYAMNTHQDGWHYEEFNANPVFLGKSEAEALESIERIRERREELREEMDW